MTIWEALVLGVLQGITEFLPVSSSGHLILGQTILGLNVADLAEFDITVHVATLVAILVYFRSDIIKLLSAFFRLDFRSETGVLNLKLLLATLPAIFFGLLFGDLVTSYFRDYRLVALLMVACGVYFLIVEAIRGRQVTQQVTEVKLGFAQALKIGFAQALAILPGISRSGSTIATAILLGISRVEAARFSFLLGSITIAGAGVLLASELADTGVKLSLNLLTIGFFASLVSSYLTVSFLMRFFVNNTLRPFGIYLVLLGLIVSVVGFV